MAKILIKRLPSSYHGLVDVRKVPDKYLRKVVEVALQERPDIPQPFAFGFRKYSEDEAKMTVSVSVARSEEVLEVLKEHPEADCIVTEEVAFASYISKINGGLAWGAIADENLNLFLVDKGCVIYSTVIPYADTESANELVNNTLRYALTLVPKLPEKGFVTGNHAERFASEELIVPFEVVESFSCDVSDVADYNLIPPEILKKRRERRFAKLVALSTFFI